MCKSIHCLEGANTPPAVPERRIRVVGGICEHIVTLTTVEEFVTERHAAGSCAANPEAVKEEK